MLIRKPAWIGTVLTTNVGRANFLFLVLFLNVGFVRSPFARWTLGKVTSIAPGQLKLGIQEESSGTTKAFTWDKDTLLWVEPTRRRQPGAVFDPERLRIGSEVRIMFKTHGDENRLIRVVQLPTSIKP